MGAMETADDYALKLPPPSEEEYEALGIMDGCTCKEYAWEAEACPFAEEIWGKDLLLVCECCPWHRHECFMDT